MVQPNFESKVGVRNILGLFQNQYHGERTKSQGLGLALWPGPPLSDVSRHWLGFQLGLYIEEAGVVYLGGFFADHFASQKKVLLPVLPRNR